MECPRCHYATSYPNAMKRHLNRQKPCNPQHSSETCLEILRRMFPNDESRSLRKTYACGKCHKLFTTRQGRNKHLQQCTSDTIVNTNTRNGLIQQLATELLNACKDDNGNLIIQNVQNIITNNSNNTTNNVQNNTITINGFGKEDLSHISTPFMHTCVKRRDKGMVELVKKRHFDEDRPQNKNLRITNKKMPFIQTYHGEKWLYCKKDKILNELVENSYMMMQEHFDDHEHELKSSMSNTMYECISEWLEKIRDQDKKVLESVLTDIYLLILNSSD